MHSRQFEQYCNQVIKAGIFRRKRNLVYLTRFLFGDVDLRKTNFLDVGGGNGLFTHYAACVGASDAVCLEPELDGSSIGLQDRFMAIAAGEFSKNAHMIRKSLQEYDVNPDYYDVVLLYDSINHLNEKACMNLLQEKSSWQAYEQLFMKLYKLVKPGGLLIIGDCSSENFWNSIGCKNPIVPQIEWNKHHPPEVWIQMAGAVGFSKKNLRWSTFNTLGKLGEALLGSRWVANFLMSHYVIWFSKPLNNTDRSREL